MNHPAMFKSSVIKGNYVNVLWASTEGVLPYLQLFSGQMEDL